MSAGLEIINLTKRFERGTPNEKTALDGLCLTVPAGEFVTVLGSNGAGKSTLFNAILGKFRPDHGRIILDGEDITAMRDYRRALNIGCLYQDPMRGTAPHMTIEENLALAYTRKAGRSFCSTRHWTPALPSGFSAGSFSSTPGACAASSARTSAGLATSGPLLSLRTGRLSISSATSILIRTNFPGNTGAS